MLLQLKNQLAGSQKNLQDMEAKISKLMDKEQASKEISTALEMNLKEIDALKSESGKLESKNASLSDSVKKMTSALRYVLFGCNHKEKLLHSK